MSGSSKMIGFDDMAPRPKTLDEANAEVLRLRKALIVSNKKWSDLWLKCNLDKKALMGAHKADMASMVNTINRLEAKLAATLETHEDLGPLSHWHES